MLLFRPKEGSGTARSFHCCRTFSSSFVLRIIVYATFAREFVQGQRLSRRLYGADVFYSRTPDILCF